MAQKKTGSKDAFDTGVEKQDKLNHDKKKLARAAKRNEDEMKSAILEVTMSTTFDKHSYGSLAKKAAKEGKKVKESKEEEKPSALAETEKHHKHHKKTAVKHEKKAHHKAHAKSSHKDKKEHHHKHKDLNSDK